MKDLKSAITPCRKKGQLVLAANLAARHLNLEGLKTLFQKARTLKLRNTDSNRRAFDKSVRDVMVKHEVQLENCCLTVRTYAAESAVTSAMAEGGLPNALQMISSDKLSEVYRPLTQTCIDNLQPRLLNQIFEQVCKILEGKASEQVKDELLMFAACVLGVPNVKTGHIFRCTVSVQTNVTSFQDMLNADQTSPTAAGHAFRAAKDGAARQDKFWQLVTVMPVTAPFFQQVRDIAHAADMRQSAIALLVNANQLVVDFASSYVKEEGAQEECEKILAVNDENWSSKVSQLLDAQESLCTRVCANMKEWITLNTDTEDVDASTVDSVLGTIRKLLLPVWHWAEKVFFSRLKTIIEVGGWLVDSNTDAQTCLKILNRLVAIFTSPTLTSTMADWQALVDKKGRALNADQSKLSLQELRCRWDLEKKLSFLQYMVMVVDVIVAYFEAVNKHDCFAGDGNNLNKRTALISLSIAADKVLEVKPGARPDFCFIDAVTRVKTVYSMYALQDLIAQNAFSISAMCVTRVKTVYYSTLGDYTSKLFHTQHADFFSAETFLPEGSSAVCI